MHNTSKQLLHFLYPILAIYGHLVSLYFGQLSKLHQSLDFHFQLACSCYQVKNIQFQCHVAKCELHDSISAIDDCIGSGQKWSSQDNRHMIGPTFYWLGIKHYKVYWVLEFVYLHQHILNYSLRNLHRSIGQ